MGRLSKEAFRKNPLPLSFEGQGDKGPPCPPCGLRLYRRGEDNKRQKVQFDYRLCKKCKICKALCPKGAIAEDEEGQPYLVHPELCNQCGLCELYCPDFAVTVEEKKVEPEISARK